MRNIKLIPGLPFVVPEIIDITDDLPRNARWEDIPKQYIHKGKDMGYRHTGFRDPADIDTIVIHHSGSPEGSLESHARYHASKWGAGISYHMAIDKGRIYQTNDLRSFTFHVGSHNTYTVGIIVNRDLSKSDLTSVERELLYAAILTVKKHLPIRHIKGHNELNATSCPCTSMHQIRQDIQNLEMQIEYMKSIEYANAKAYEIANQTLYLYNLLERGNEGQQKWARAQLLKLYPFMKEQGLIK